VAFPDFRDPVVLRLLACGLVVLLAAAFLIWRRFRPRPTPEETERLRRLAVHASGKLIAGQVVDVNVPMVNYSYIFAGVEYSASQDTTGLESLMPADPMHILGATGVKFDPRNPANSIVICEKWSGFGRLRS